MLLVLAMGGIGCDRANRAPAPSSTSQEPGAPSSAAPKEGSPKDDAVSFAVPEPAVGDVYETTFRMEAASLHSHSELPGIEQASGMDIDVVATVEVVGVAGGRETKWKITVDRAQIRSVVGRGKASLPLAGKTVLAERKGDGIVTTDADGEGADFVSSLLEPFDGWALPRRPLREGESIPELVSSKPGSDDQLARTARFVKRAGDIGWFERVVGMKDDDVSMTMTCRVGIRVGDGRVVSSVCASSGTTVASDPSASGQMRFTATRRRKGEPTPPLPDLDEAAKPSTKAPGSFEAVCYGGASLTDAQRMFFQEELDAGIDRCPKWGSAEITVGSRGLEVNGQTILPEAALPASDRLAELTPLAERLDRYREAWKSFHPLGAFPGEVTIVAPKGTATAAVVSAALTAGRSGFPNIRIEVGSTVVRFMHFLPVPPNLRPPPRVVYVEPLAGNGLVVGELEVARKLDHQATLAGVNEFEGWLGPRCANEPCFGRLVFRPLAVPIEQTLAVLQPLLSAKPFTQDAPHLSFSFGCDVVAVPTQQDALKGPWGSRTPTGPCF